MVLKWLEAIFCKKNVHNLTALFHFLGIPAALKNEFLKRYFITIFYSITLKLGLKEPENPLA